MLFAVTPKTDYQNIGDWGLAECLQTKLLLHSFTKLSKTLFTVRNEKQE
jgi:hypothetical protein